MYSDGWGSLQHTPARPTRRGTHHTSEVARQGLHRGHDRHRQLQRDLHPLTRRFGCPCLQRERGRTMLTFDDGGRGRASLGALDGGGACVRLSRGVMRSFGGAPDA